MYLTAKFDRPTVCLVVGRYRVDKHHAGKLTNTVTNKQTPLKTFTSFSYATPVGKNGWVKIVMSSISRLLVQSTSSMNDSDGKAPL